jgi:hypothetical protein
MANPAFATVDDVKNYVEEIKGTQTEDAFILEIIEEVTDAFIGRIDDVDNFTTTTLITAITPDLRKACAKQAAYNYKRRKDLGLTTVTYRQGSITKESQSHDEFLPSVLKVVDRYRKYAI